MSVSTTPGPHYIKNSKRIIWIYLLLFVCSIGLLWWLWHLFGWWLIGIILLYLLGKQRNKISISQWFNQTISWIKSKGQAGPRLTTIFGIALIVFAVWFARYTYEDWQAKRAFRHEQEDRRVVCISKDNSISAIELAKISDLPVGKVT